MLSQIDQNPGRTIQLFLPEGTADGLKIASLHGWAGSVLVASNATLPKLLKREEAKRTGIYVLFGPDPDTPLTSRVYIGEADAINDRLPNSASKHGFWETVAVITASDESLTKAHVRFLEAMLIAMTEDAGRTTLDNVQKPDPNGIHLPEADRANMFDFLRNIRMILPVVGFDFLKPKAKSASQSDSTSCAVEVSAQVFEIRHKSGVDAQMIEVGNEYLVLKGSQAMKDGTFKENSYAALKETLMESGKLVADGTFYIFTDDVTFNSPSAAAAVILDRNSNGRVEWKVAGQKTTYAAWQDSQSEPAQ